MMVFAIQGATTNLVNSTREIATIRLPVNLRHNVLLGVKIDLSGIDGAMISVSTKPVIGTVEIARNNMVIENLKKKNQLLKTVQKDVKTLS